MTGFITGTVPSITTGGRPCPICGIFIIDGVMHLCGGSASPSNIIPMTPFPPMGWLCMRCGTVRSPLALKCTCRPRKPEETSADAK